MLPRVQKIPVSFQAMLLFITAITYNPDTHVSKMVRT